MKCWWHPAVAAAAAAGGTFSYAHPPGYVSCPAFMTTLGSRSSSSKNCGECIHTTHLFRAHTMRTMHHSSKACTPGQCPNKWRPYCCVVAGGTTDATVHRCHSMSNSITPLCCSCSQPARVLIQHCQLWPALRQKHRRAICLPLPRQHLQPRLEEAAGMCALPHRLHHKWHYRCHISDSMW